MAVRNQLRETLRAKRQTLPRAVQRLAAQQLAERLLAIPTFNNSQHIAAYHAVMGEIDPVVALTQARILGKNCYLPILVQQRLEFAAHKPGDFLAPNRYGIPEPSPNEIIPLTHLDLVLVPLIAFDLQGNRLGTGGGYYDRTFAFLQSHKRPAKPYLLGIAYDWQQIDQIPSESWDVRLDGIVTDKNFYAITG